MMRLFRVVLSIFIILGLLFALPGLVNLSQQTTRNVSRAVDIPARIVVDTRNVTGPMPGSFRALSQGGEEQNRWLAPVVAEVKELAPRYIRIDHIYDFYHVVRKEGDNLTFDFSHLDPIVDDILATGARPFFSFSYMPQELSSDGTPLGLPKSWDQWSAVIQKTIEHYSGKGQRNLGDVYYEVWNEPDLFGHFTMGGAKDYGKLYEYAVRGANATADTNAYFFGGPAITGPMPTWSRDFLRVVSVKNLRLDFFSYHRYSLNPDLYEKDARAMRQVLQEFPKFATLPLVLSEWGPDSEINAINDEPGGAAFTVVAIRRMMDLVSLIMPFEVKDGPSPSGREFWGRWGILTHETFGKHAKPRYHALRLLGKLTGVRLGVTGEGTYVSALATLDTGKVSILLVNYDQSGKNSEAAPLTVKGLTNGIYTYTVSDLTSEISTSRETVSGGELVKTILMPPQSIRLIQLETVKDRAMYVSGKSGQTSDFAIVLDGKNKRLEFSPPEFSLLQGKIEFSLKLPSDGTDEKTLPIFTLPLSATPGTKREFGVKKQVVSLGPRIVFGLFEDGHPKETVSTSVLNWKKAEWHDVGFAWGPEGLKLSVDGRVVEERKEPFLIGFGTVLTFENSGITLDNLHISDSTRELTVRNFDGTMDR